MKGFQNQVLEAVNNQPGLELDLHVFRNQVDAKDAIHELASIMYVIQKTEKFFDEMPDLGYLSQLDMSETSDLYNLILSI